MTPDPLPDLLARLEAAEGPNFELDRQIAVAFGFGKLSGEASIEWFSGGFSVPPTYTASLDAAVALVEKMYPGWHWCAQKRPDTAIGYITNNEMHYSGLSAARNPRKRWYEERHQTSPSIALLTALCKALIAEREEE